MSSDTPPHFIWIQSSHNYKCHLIHRHTLYGSTHHRIISVIWYTTTRYMDPLIADVTRDNFTVLFTPFWHVIQGYLGVLEAPGLGHGCTSPHNGSEHVKSSMFTLILFDIWHFRLLTLPAVWVAISQKQLSSNITYSDTSKSGPISNLRDWKIP